MSRTTHKYIKLFPTCTRPQVNTQWYKMCRRKYRAKNKNLLRYLMANYHVNISIDTEVIMFSDLKAKTVDDTIFAIKPRTKYDDRNEPSDGRYILNYRYFNHRYSKDKESTYYWIKRLPEYQRKIKPKVREYKH